MWCCASTEPLLIELRNSTEVNGVQRVICRIETENEFPIANSQFPVWHFSATTESSQFLSFFYLIFGFRRPHVFYLAYFVAVILGCFCCCCFVWCFCYAYSLQSAELRKPYSLLPYRAFAVTMYSGVAADANSYWQACEQRKIGKAVDFARSH